MSRVPSAATPSPAEYLAMLESEWMEANAGRVTSAPTLVSTFCGGGGSSLGYLMAGYREVFATDWDADAMDTFRLNFPDVPVWQGDIAELSIEQIVEVTGLPAGELDVLDGSPPCQGFSTAGKRIMADSRNTLFREFVRLLRGLQPRCFVMENVGGMVRGRMKLVFADCLRELKASGYRVSARVLDAMYFGVPQQRKRLIVIGFRENLDIEPTHPVAASWPVPLRVALGAASLAGDQDGDAVAPPLSDVYGRMWDRVPLGLSARDVSGQGFSSCVKPHPDRPCRTLTKTQTGRGFATMVHPWQERAISIREAAMISSYPPAFQFTGTYQQQWARIGNGVPPLLMRAIASHLRTSVLVPTGVQMTEIDA